MIGLGALGSLIGGGGRGLAVPMIAAAAASACGLGLVVLSDAKQVGALRVEAQRFADIARNERAAGNRLRSSVKASADAQAQAQAAVRAAHARAARLLRALADRPAPDGACPRGCIVDVPTDPD